MFGDSKQSSGQAGQTTPGTDDETALGRLLQIDPPSQRTKPVRSMVSCIQNRGRCLGKEATISSDDRELTWCSTTIWTFQGWCCFEAVAEGGVTRFMGLFYCAVQAQDTTLAPVRSARTYFVDWASGFNRPLYVHVGGANHQGQQNALGQIADYGWALENDLNQFSIGYPTFVRNAARLDKEVATEHTMETTTEKLWAVGESVAGQICPQSCSRQNNPAG